jgi:hypothetical protein
MNCVTKQYFTSAKTKMILRSFVFLSGCILLFTGSAKIFSTFGTQGILSFTDPIFKMHFRYVMIAAGVIELIVSGICLFSKKMNISLGLIAWLATIFLVYRLGLLYVGWSRPCHCMGNFFDAIHVAPKTADLVTKCMLVYLLVGSWAFLCLQFFDSLKARQKP